jgi:hypothetical protein
MNGKLDPEERVMSESNNNSWISDLHQALNKLKWEHGDNIAVEIGGTSIYEIEGAGTKWAPVKGTRKYNKDAFIVIKNLDKNPTVPSQPNPELKPHHIMVNGQQIPIQQDLNDKTN